MGMQLSHWMAVMAMVFGSGISAAQYRVTCSEATPTSQHLRTSCNAIDTYTAHHTATAAQTAGAQARYLHRRPRIRYRRPKVPSDEPGDVCHVALTQTLHHNGTDLLSACTRTASQAGDCGHIVYS